MEYFQAENQEISFLVWKSKEKCAADNNCNHSKITKYKNSDIVAPRFVDIDIFKNYQVLMFLNWLVSNEELCQLRSFLDINNKSYHKALTQVLGFKCTDIDNEQYLKHIKGRIYQVVEKNTVNLVDLDYYSEKNLDIMARHFYPDGMSEINKMGEIKDEILAEIVSETLSIN